MVVFIPLAMKACQNQVPNMLWCSIQILITVFSQIITSRIKELTSRATELFIIPSRTDSGFECAIGVTGKDVVLFMRGVKIFVSDHDLDMEGFSCVLVVDEPESRLAVFSASELELRYLKLSLGSKFLMDGLALDEEG